MTIHPLFPDQVGIWKVWFLWWEDVSNSKLNPLMTKGPGFEPGPHWWEASPLTPFSRITDIIIKCDVLFLPQGAQGLRGQEGDPGETGLSVSI